MAYFYSMTFDSYDLCLDLEAVRARIDDEYARADAEGHGEWYSRVGGRALFDLERCLEAALEGIEHE